MSKFRWLVALLCAVSLFATACGGSNDDAESAEETEVTEAADDSADEPADDGDDEPADDADEPADDADEPADDADEPADDGDDGADDAADPGGCAANTPDGTRGVDKEAGVITIGTSQPFTGRAAVAGEGLLAGVQMAVDEVNANGGIDGCNVPSSCGRTTGSRSSRWSPTSAR